jgi:hypothetical protein
VLARWASTRDVARAVRSPKISVVGTQTDSYIAQLTDQTSQQLRGRSLAGLESLSDRSGDVEVGAIIRLDEADKLPLLDVLEVWVGRTGEEQLSSTGILQLRERLRTDLGERSKAGRRPISRTKPPGLMLVVRAEMRQPGAALRGRLNLP